MSIERYSSATLMAMQEEMESPSRFFTNFLFSTEVYFDDQFVEMDIVRKGRRMAPFVAPTVRGRPISRDGFMTKIFKPAYVKQTTTIDLTRPLKRMAGESWGKGDLSPMQRFDRLMSEDIALHADTLAERIEWMSVKAILDGGYVVKGPNYPEVYVDFGQSPSLSVALAGAATWDQVTATPLDDIEQLALDIRNESYGAVARDVIMDPLAWRLFRAHASIKDLLDLDVKRDDLAGTNFDLGIRNDRYGQAVGAELVGRVAGRFNIWVYEAYYEDEAGNEVAYMPDYTVILIAAGAVEGKQLYGAILDRDAQYQSVKQFLKSKSQWDPSGEMLLSQSAPLVMPGRVNTWGVLTVA